MATKTRGEEKIAGPASGQRTGGTTNRGGVGKREER